MISCARFLRALNFLLQCCEHKCDFFASSSTLPLDMKADLLSVYWLNVSVADPNIILETVS